MYSANISTVISTAFDSVTFAIIIVWQLISQRKSVLVQYCIHRYNVSLKLIITGKRNTVNGCNLVVNICSVLETFSTETSKNKHSFSAMVLVYSERAQNAKKIIYLSHDLQFDDIFSSLWQSNCPIVRFWEKALYGLISLDLSDDSVNVKIE